MFQSFSESICATQKLISLNLSQLEFLLIAISGSILVMNQSVSTDQSISLTDLLVKK